MLEEKLNEQVNSETNEVNEPVTDSSLVVDEVATEVVKEESNKKEKKKKSKLRNAIEWVLTGLFGVLFLVSAIGQIDGMMNRNKHYGEMIRLGFGSFYVLTDSMDPVYKKKSAIITYLEDSDVVYKRYLEYKTYNDAKRDEYIAAHPEVEVSENGYVLSNSEDWRNYQLKNFKHIDLTFMGINVNAIAQPDDPTLTAPAYPPTPFSVTHRLREMHLVEGKQKGQGKYVFVCAGINTNGELAKESQYQAFTEKELLGTVKVGNQALGWFFSALSSPWGLLIFLLVPALYLVITSVFDILRALKEPEEANASSGGNDKPKVDSLEGLSAKDKERLKKELLEEMLKGKDKK